MHTLPTAPVNIEAEQALLGALLSNNDHFMKVTFLSENHFSNPVHQRIYAAFLEMRSDGEVVTPVTLMRRFQADGDLQDIGGSVYLAKLAAASLGMVGLVSQYAKEVRAQYLLRELQRDCATALDDVVNSPKTAEEIAGQLAKSLEQIVSAKTAEQVRDDLAITVEILEDMKTQPDTISTGMKKLDEAMGGGLHAGKLYGFAARKKVGKAQPLDAKVLTLSGWKRMGDIRLDDELASPDGLPSKVTGLFPQGSKEIWRVTFSDGRSVECCPDHLWEVEGYRGKGVEVIDTRELARRSKLSLPTYIPWFHGDFGGGELPIDPYLLGALLGDGGLSQNRVAFSTADEEMLRFIAPTLPSGLKIKHISRYDYGFRVPHGGGNGNGPINPLLNDLRDLGLSGKRSEKKFIPALYLNATTAARWELLRGLMDTDGYVTKTGSICFDTSSPKLARDVRQLVRSLGGSAKVKKKRTTHLFTYKVKIRHAFPSECFKLSRKKLRAIDKRKHQCRLSVKNVKFSRMAEAQCISTSHPRRLYITDEFTVTHNTVLASTISFNLNLQNVKHLFICGEMGPKEIHQRNLSRALSVKPYSFRGDYRHNYDFQKRIMDVARTSNRAILYQNAPGLTFDDLRRYCTAAIYQHKVKGIILDYLQLVGGKPKNKSTAEHLDDVAQWLATFCKQHGIWIITMAQINQEGNTRGGEGLRLACDQCYEIHRDDITQPQTWLEMMDTRYTEWMNIGSKEIPGLIMNPYGPFFEVF